jgi:translocation and assembly module TamA
VDDQQQQVVLNIRLQDTEKYILKTDLGYGTDSGGRFGISWQDLRVNDHGHNYLLSFTINEIENVTSVQYKIPIVNTRDEWLNRFSYRYKNDDIAISKTTTLESRWVLRHNDYWSTQWAASLSSQSIESNSAIESYLEYLIPSFQVNYLSVTDPFVAEEGWRWQGEIKLGNETLTDPDLNFVQIEQKVKFIDKLTDNWRILVRGHLGFTEMDTASFINRMPTHYRYQTGGDASVRGYEFQSLSPSDNDGNLVGGKHLITSSIEVDWQFSDSWRWAWFVDMGNAFNDYSEMDLKRSSGTGVRWLTPVGAIRIDYARALDSPEKWRLHITLGPDL